MDSSTSSETEVRRHQWPATSSSTPFRLDEGFSEETSSQDENGRLTIDRFQQWIMGQSEDERGDLAYEILRTIRTSKVAGVVERLRPLLHMDPLEKLPAEIAAEIFSYLDAQTLLTASLASRTWRTRTLDSRLWQHLFNGQGWGIEPKEIRAFEETHTGLVRPEHRRVRAQFRSSENTNGQPQLKKRATSDWLESRGRQLSAEVSQWREQHGTIEADVDVQSDCGDEEMEDAPASVQDSPQRPNKRHSQDSGDEMDYFPQNTSSLTGDTRIAPTTADQAEPFRTTLLRHDTGGNERINWSYLFKQRQRLEDNWTHGRFTNFQLPHPSYPLEAHTECVYTIQFYGKWLVSGSRDKTLRVWDLETRRLVGKPLIGHTQSVLCLQFDPTEEEDVIISGSSDSSIIVWRFSTRQKIYEIPSAHEESVLNLRFDRRYLVTCSKDKKIKVWNRHQLLPTDADYPKLPANTEARVPSYILDLSTMEPSMLEARIANGTIKALKPYSHVMTFMGHNAAVNAIQIDGDQIVSASGDRSIKLWSLKTGKMEKTLAGHLKGIACVQFDSKRVVSGSSDNTVRIYDSATGAEVAVLKGHTNLVRTVQAGFGDAPGSEAEFETEARAAERKYREDVASGVIVEDRNYIRRVRNGETGSSRIALGAKLPPGGGGSKWGRIVSGSYDESIIIWRKNAHGDWVIGQTLRQESAIRASSESRQHSSDQQAPQPQPQPQQQQQQHQHQQPPLPPPPPPVVDNHGPVAPAGPSSVAGPSNMPAISASQLVQQAMGTSFASLGAGISNVMGIARNMNGPLANWSVPPRSTVGQASINASTSFTGTPQQIFNQMAQHTQSVMNQAVQQAITDAQSDYHQQAATIQAQQQAQQQQQPQQGQQLPTPAAQPQSQMTLTGPVQTLPTVASSVGLQPPTPNIPPPQVAGPAPVQVQAQAQAQAHPPQHHHHHHHHHHHNHHHNNNNNNHANANGHQSAVSRVFKLQFDARRIVCCSQDSRIIGWDFANSDPEIESVAKFFVGP